MDKKYTNWVIEHIPSDNNKERWRNKMKQTNPKKQILSTHIQNMYTCISFGA